MMEERDDFGDIFDNGEKQEGHKGERLGEGLGGMVKWAFDQEGILHVLKGFVSSASKGRRKLFAGLLLLLFFWMLMGIYGIVSLLIDIL